jgi:hypothetical protein
MDHPELASTPRRVNPIVAPLGRRYQVISGMERSNSTSAGARRSFRMRNSLPKRVRGSKERDADGDDARPDLGESDHHGEHAWSSSRILFEDEA